jgi:uncharacterized protein (DUF849 family)
MVESVMQLLQAALNGYRDHPAAHRTPAGLATDALAAVEAGAQCFHIHAWGRQGRETLDADACAAMLVAVRRACPGVQISLSTAAYVEPDPGRRLKLVRSWSELPDIVSANVFEEGIVELCDLLRSRGVGIEAGVLTVEDARTFVAQGFESFCERILIEPRDDDPHAAVATAEAIETILADAGSELEQIHHGQGIATWAVQQRAAARGHGIRAGIEDTTVLPDGAPAASNAEILAAASALLGRGLPT